VGVSAGISGLLRYIKEGMLEGRDFQFTTQDMSRAKNWLPSRSFLAVVEAAKAGFPNVDAIISCAPSGDLALPGDLLCWLAEQKSKPLFYVGVKGGAARLNEMNHVDVTGRRWGISTQKRTEQWVDSSTFAKLYRQAESR